MLPGRYKLDAAIRIRVSGEGVGIGWWSKADKLGYATFDTRVSFLTTAKVLRLEGGSKAGTLLWFRIDGFPKEPNLPPYSYVTQY